MQRFRLLIVVLLTLGLGATEHKSSVGKSSAGQKPSASKTYPVSTIQKQEDDIREAVFRYQFKHNASGLQQKAGAYFLLLGKRGKRTDPNDEFMKRFKGHRPIVKKRSEAKVSFEEGVRDKKTGKGGLIFYIEEIKWINSNQVEVKGGYHEASLSASHNTYYVVKKNNKWVVTKDKMHSIS